MPTMVSLMNSCPAHQAGQDSAHQAGQEHNSITLQKIRITVPSQPHYQRYSTSVLVAGSILELFIGGYNREVTSRDRWQHMFKFLSNSNAPIVEMWTPLRQVEVSC